MQLALKRCLAALVLATALSCDIKGTDWFWHPDGEPPTGDLTGLVASGPTPVNGAKVVISGVASDSVNTGSNGIYLFNDLRTGLYNVSATAPNFTCASGQGTVEEDEVTTINLNCTPVTGSLAGNVTFNLSPRAGVVISAVQGSNTVASATTGMNGAYLMSQLLPGIYNAIITVPQGATCNQTQQAVTIRGDSTSRADFNCTTPGTIAGVVTIDTALTAGVSVTISQGTTVVRTLTTNAQGAYSATGLAAGTYTVTVAPPGSATCASNPRSVTVTGDQTTTENFLCTTPVSPSFTIQFGDPPFSYLHVGPGNSNTCAGFTTTPLKPGGSWTATWSGPGIVGSNTRSGTLDANGKAIDRQPINQFGTYNLNLSVTSGGFTANGTGSISVTSAQGSCPP